MIRPGEALVFVSLAAGLHVGAWSIAPQLRGAGADGGPQPAPVTLAVAAPQQAALMRDWQAPPDMATDTPAPVAPPAEVSPPRRPDMAQAGPRLAPVAGLTPVLPAAAQRQRPDPAPTVVPAPEPTALAPPKADRRADPGRFRATMTPRPKAPRPDIPRPDAPAQADRTTPAPPPPPKTARPAEPPSVAAPRAASGGGGRTGKRAATTDADRAQSAGAAARDKAQAQWGARIQRQVHRRLIYPRGASGSGTARVSLTVDRAGRLTALRLTRSSGAAAFDKAALSAVRRAGRFPSAPEALTRASYTFTLSLAFRP